MLIYNLQVYYLLFICRFLHQNTLTNQSLDEVLLVESLPIEAVRLDNNTFFVYWFSRSEVAHFRSFNGSNLYLSSLYVEREHCMPRHLAMPANKLKFMLLLIEDFYLLLRHLLFLRGVQYLHIAYFFYL